ncbi:HD-domain/PDEase-like protein [Pholiota conissans]|uniref:HD-domain/PDEase-like protein n=1 Tax=Pholiota conissans TaxID=109636 RepID=A0A9P6CVN0_9AGAR|nr:HD-domain/PDEase-like protein [Pholiota conissans]
MSNFEDIDDQRDSADDIAHVTHRHIKDPIHNYIPISPTLARFIDTKQFQRLRNIKQLGTTQYVWPGGSHTRFEHSLGVAHLARTMATHLQKSQRELGITDRDVDCVEIAGLCHDLGHGPWSHVWDGIFIPIALAGTGKTWKHEDGSEMMFDYLVRDNNIPISLKDQEFVKALIAGDHSRVPDEKPFLFDIVANKRNGLDVDKFDYIHRDSHMIGEPIHLSLARFVTSARVINNEICYAIKDANNIYEMGQTRFKLHKIFYNHKTATAIEYMIIDALIAAEPVLKIAEDVFKPERFLHLTDHIMSRIEASQEPELAESRAIFDRIHSRDLYKCVDYKVIDWPLRGLFRKHVKPEHIIAAIQGSAEYPISAIEGYDALLASPEAKKLEKADVIVAFSTMHYGMKEKNVLDFVKFYSKSKPNESMKAERGVYSNLMPTYFGEDLLRVYTKKPEYAALVQAGYRAILAKLERDSGGDAPPTLATAGIISSVRLDEAKQSQDPVPTLTPPAHAAETPSTPKAQGSIRDAALLFFAGSKTVAATTPFSNNSFTTVIPSAVPASPTRSVKKGGAGAGGKKRHLDDGVSGDGPLKKRR